MNEQEAIIDLIDILLNSCTAFSSENDSVQRHEHNLFDNIDRDRLKELRDKLKG